MNKKISLYIFIAILVAIIIIAISIVVRSYNADKPIAPDANNKQELSLVNMAGIKEKYNNDGKEEEFLEVCKGIELAVANKLLDGSVTNDNELAVKIADLNDMFNTSDWTYLGVEFPSYWMGKWSLDKSGKLHFAFKAKEIVPDWASKDSVSKYIIGG